MLSASNSLILRDIKADSTPETIMQENHSARIFSLALVPDTSFFLASKKSTIYLFELGSTKPVKEFLEHTGDVRCLAIIPGRNLFVSGSSDRTLIIWSLDVTTSSQSVRVLKGHTSLVLSAAVSTDGTQIVSGSVDSTLRVWNAQNGDMICVMDAKPFLDSPTPWIYGCTFFGEQPAFLKPLSASTSAQADLVNRSSFCLAGGGNIIMIWNTTDGALYSKFSVPDSEKLLCVCLLGDSLVACGSVITLFYREKHPIFLIEKFNSC